MFAYHAKWIPELRPGQLWPGVVAPMGQIELFDI